MSARSETRHGFVCVWQVSITLSQTNPLDVVWPYLVSRKTLYIYIYIYIYVYIDQF